MLRLPGGCRPEAAAGNGSVTALEARPWRLSWHHHLFLSRLKIAQQLRIAAARLRSSPIELVASAQLSRLGLTRLIDPDARPARILQATQFEAPFTHRGGRSDRKSTTPGALATQGAGIIATTVSPDEMFPELVGNLPARTARRSDTYAAGGHGIGDGVTLKTRAGNVRR